MKKSRNLRRISWPLSMEGLILNEREIFTTRRHRETRGNTGGTLRFLPIASTKLVMQSSAGHFGKFRAWRHPMPCNPEILRQVPLFALLDDEETAVLAGQVEVKHFAARQRIYKMGEPGGRAYVVVSGMVRVTTVDEDQQ